MSETTTLPSSADNAPLVTIELPPQTAPYLSFALLALLILIFVAEVAFAIDAPTEPLTPGIRTLVALGGLQKMLTLQQGQWWRLFTGPLLHAGPVHLAMNGLVLVLAGAVLERAVGRLWFAAIFVVGALGGACGTLFLDPRNLVSVGASGAIMGLFAAILVISFRYQNKQVRGLLQRRAFQVLVPSFLPLAGAAQIGKIDYAAHAGGAIAGGIAAYFLSELWRDTDTLPGFRWTAAALLLFGLVGALTGAVEVALDVRSTQARLVPFRSEASRNPIPFQAPQQPLQWQAPQQPLPSKTPQPSLQSEAPQTLIPSEYLPKKTSDIHEALAWWYVAKYPADPRSHFYRALFLLRTPDLPEAERELGIALQQQSALDKELQPSFGLDLHWTLALVLLDEDRLDEARQVAADACLDPSSTRSADLQAKGLCIGSN